MTPTPKTVDANGNVITHRATLENGPNVVNGKLVWTSATGITVADTNSYGGCLRRFYFEQVLEQKAPPTKAMLGGADLHADIENHLRTGQRLQLPLALAGSMFIPQPGGNLQVERPIHFKTKVGVDIYGHVDLYNFRQEYIDPNGELLQDPSWSFEVKDWKTTADFQYAKTPGELAANIQLVTYSEAGFRFAPDMEHARHTHVYFRTKGAPASKLVTIRNTREEIGARWEYAESVVRSMADVAREPSAETVPGNRASCDAYRGCPHRAKCSVYGFNSLDSLFAKVASDHLQEKSKVGIIANNPGLMQQQGAAQAQAPQAPAPQQDMQQRLAQEEAQMRAQVAQQQQQMPMNQAAGADLLTVCYRISQAGYGFPKLVGNAAQAYAAANSASVAPGYEYPGVMAPAGAKRSLHTLPLSEVAHIYQLDGEVSRELAANPAPMLPQLPPAVAFVPAPGQGTPASSYALQPQTWTLPPGSPAPAQAPTSFLAPNAPESMPQLAQQNTAPAAPSAEEKPKTRRGRPKATPVPGTAPEAVAPPPSSATQTAAPAQTSTPSAPPTQVTPAAAPTIVGLDGFVPTGIAQDGPIDMQIYVNARCEGVVTKSLAGYVDYVNDTLAKRYNVDKQGKPGPLDCRTAVDGSILGYGGWKGAVRTIVLADPPPDGHYHFDTFMSEMNEIVADALRNLADQRGWHYVRGLHG